MDNKQISYLFTQKGTHPRAFIRKLTEHYKGRMEWGVEVGGIGGWGENDEFGVSLVEFIFPTFLIFKKLVFLEKVFSKTF